MKGGVSVLAVLSLERPGGRFALYLNISSTKNGEKVNEGPRYIRGQNKSDKGRVTR